VSPPDRTRCSPGLASPSGFSPLDQLDGGQRDQDPLQPGSSHHWRVPRSSGLDSIDPWRRPESPQTDTKSLTFRGLSSCTSSHACMEADTQAGPPKIFLVRVVAFLLYFGRMFSCRAAAANRVEPTAQEQCARPGPSRRAAFTVAREEHDVIDDLGERGWAWRRSAWRCPVQDLSSALNLPIQAVHPILDGQESRPSWGFVRQRPTRGWASR